MSRKAHLTLRESREWSPGTETKLCATVETTYIGNLFSISVTNIIASSKYLYLTAFIPGTGSICSNCAKSSLLSVLSAPVTVQESKDWSRGVRVTSNKSRRSDRH